MQKFGTAVHIGARVTALAAPGEVLVSQTVRDLVAGLGLTFAERGVHTLKGAPSEWRLFLPRDNQGETAASIRMRMRRGWTDGARA